MKRKKFLQYRRKLEGKTDYRKRLELLKCSLPRIVVRKSLKSILVQAIEYDPNGDKTILSITSRDLSELGWKGSEKNIPAAYLIGYLFGMKAKQKKIQEAILDKGLYPTRQGIFTFAVLKGITDSGLKVPHDPSIFPAEDRIKGKHISENIEKMFEQVKSNIQKVK